MLYLDIKGAFPSVLLNRLVHNMRQRGVLKQYTRWLKQKVENRHTVLSFDGFASEPKALARGLDQGCPLSGIACQFYNADLLDIPIHKNGEDAAVYMDDANLLAEGDDFEESNGKIKDMMERPKGGLNWSTTH
jgi:hypothetical protein